MPQISGPKASTPRQLAAALQRILVGGWHKAAPPSVTRETKLPWLHFYDSLTELRPLNTRASTTLPFRIHHHNRLDQLSHHHRRRLLAFKPSSFHHPIAVPRAIARNEKQREASTTSPQLPFVSLHTTQDGHPRGKVQPGLDREAGWLRGL